MTHEVWWNYQQSGCILHCFQVQLRYCFEQNEEAHSDCGLVEENALWMEVEARIQGGMIAMEDVSL
jgi:hypothetical protein